MEQPKNNLLLIPSAASAVKYNYMSNAQNDIIAEDEQERLDEIQENTDSLEEKLEAIDPEEEKFLAEQAKLIAEQEALNMGADPSNIN